MAKLQTIDQMWMHYLGLVNPKGVVLSDIQTREMRNAFYAAAGTILVYLRDDLGSLPDAVAVKELEKLHVETKKYWNKVLEDEVKRKTEGS